MGFLDKMKSKVENRLSDKIVDAVFGEKKKEVENEVIVQQQAIIEEQQRQLAQQQTGMTQEQLENLQANPETYEAQMAARDMAMARAVAGQNGNIPSADDMEKMMGIAYNTKRCPSCQAICMNAPVECPYCHADLKGVKPLTPKELEELE